MLPDVRASFAPGAGEAAASPNGDMIFAFDSGKEGKSGGASGGSLIKASCRKDLFVFSDKLMKSHGFARGQQCMGSAASRAPACGAPMEQARPGLVIGLANTFVAISSGYLRMP